MGLSQYTTCIILTCISQLKSSVLDDHILIILLNPLLFIESWYRKIL